MVKIDDKQACQIHGIISSDSDSDCDGKKEFDEEYNLLKPPPLDIESIKDRLVVISPEHDPNSANVSEERMEITENDAETDNQIESNTASSSKKKKKREFKYVIRSLSDEDLSAAADVFEPPNKKQPDKIWYDPELLKEMREQLDKLDYYGLRRDIFTQKLTVLEKQGIGCFKTSNDSQSIKPKKNKKKKQKQLTEGIDSGTEQLGKEPKQETTVTEETSEDNIVRDTREVSNEVLPTTSANNRGKISCLQELEYTFGNDFRDFLQSVIRGGTSILELNSFTYEQLSGAYKAHLERRKSNATDNNTIGKAKEAPVQQNMFYPNFQNNTRLAENVKSAPVQQNGFYPALQNNTVWNCPPNQNTYQPYPPVQQNSWPWNYPGQSNTNNMRFPYFYTTTSPSPNIRLDFYLPPNLNGGNFLNSALNSARCIPSTSTDKVILTEIEDVKTTDMRDKKDVADGVQQNLNSNNVAETNKKTVGSVQDTSQSVIVKEKCEVKNVQTNENFFHSENFDTLLIGSMQTFTESRRTIFSLNRKAEKRLNKTQFLKCKEHIITFLKVNEKALVVIKSCLDMYSQIENGKKGNGTTINKKKFTRQFQHSEAILNMCIKDMEDCEKKVLDIFNVNYNVVMKIIISARGVLGKCKLACNNIKNEMKKSNYDSAQINETAISKNDFIKEGEGLSLHLTNSNKSVTSGHKTDNDSEKENCEVTNAQTDKYFFYSTNFDALLNDSIQVFMEGSQTILLVYRKAQEMINKREFLECVDHIVNFSMITEDALSVIRCCLEMCTLVQNEKNSNDTMIKNKKDFIKDFQYSETVLSMRVENIKNCDKRLMNVYKPQYNRFIDIITVARAMLEKCKLACNNINKEIKKTICESAQVDQAVSSKNDNQETCNRSDAPFPETIEEEKNKNVKEVAESLVNAGSVQDISQSVTVKEKCEVNNVQAGENLFSKNCNTLLKGCIQTFTENRQIILSLNQKVESRLEKPQFLKCKESMIKFLRVNEEALHIIKRCLEKCTQIKNGKKSNSTMKVFTKEFQYSETALNKCIEDIEDCERKVIDIIGGRHIAYNMQYNGVMKAITKTRCVLGKCKLACNDINNEIKKGNNDSAQVDETGSSKNNFIKEDVGLTLHLTNPNESVMSAQTTDNDSEKLLLDLGKSNEPKKTISNSMQETDMSVDNKLSKKKSEKVKEVAETLSNVGSFQDISQSVTVKEEKCEVKNIQTEENFFYSKNFGSLLSSSIQIFMEGIQIILSVYRKAQEMITKSEFSECADRIANFSIINEEALSIIRRCLEMCTLVQNEKGNGTSIKNKKDFIKDFQYSETVLSIRVENIKNCEKRLMNVYKPQYNRFVDIIIVSHGMLEKCKLACNNINKEIKKNICESAQVDKAASSKNDGQETCNKGDAPFLETNEDEKNKSVTKNKTLHERNTDYLDDENIQSSSTQQNLNLTQNVTVTNKKTGTKNKEKLMPQINKQGNDSETKESINERLKTQDNTTKIQSITAEPETDSNSMQESLINARSIQNVSQSVTVKEEKCEVKNVQTDKNYFYYSKNFDTLLSGFMQTFTAGRETILSVCQKAEKLIIKPHFSECEEHITDFLRINEEALGIIKRCLEKCTYIQNGKEPKNTDTNIKEIFTKDFQYSETALNMCVENIENCERRLLEDYKIQYNHFVKVIIVARAMLGKCKLTCKEINEEIKKRESTQVDENASLKNDCIKKDEGLTIHLTNSNKNVTSTQETDNNGKKLLLDLEKPNDSLKSSQETYNKSDDSAKETDNDRGRFLLDLEKTNDSLKSRQEPCNKGDASSLENNDDEKNKPVTNDKTLDEGNTDNLNDVNNVPCRCFSTKNSTSFNSTAKGSFYENINFVQFIEYFTVGFSSDLSWGYIALLSLISFLLIEATRCVFSFLSDNFINIWIALLLFMYLKNRQ